MADASMARYDAGSKGVHVLGPQNASVRAIRTDNPLESIVEEASGSGREVGNERIAGHRRIAGKEISRARVERARCAAPEDHLARRIRGDGAAAATAAAPGGLAAIALKAARGETDASASPPTLTAGAFRDAVFGAAAKQLCYWATLVNTRVSSMTVGRSDSTGSTLIFDPLPNFNVAPSIR
jgi:hypothetical protein